MVSKISEFHKQAAGKGFFYAMYCRWMKFLRRRRVMYVLLLVRRLRILGLHRFARDILNIGRFALLSGRSENAPDPLYIQIEPTSRCNLRCRMCVRNDPSHSPQDMSFDQFLQILDKLPSVLFCTIQGNGEPLLNPEVFDMIRYAANKGIAPITCTNATLLDEQTAVRLATGGLYECAVSLESPDKEKFEYIRKGSDFDVYRKNIELLSNTRDRLNPRLVLSFWVTITGYTSADIEDCIRFAGSVGFDHIVFQQIQGKKSFRKNYGATFDKSPMPAKKYDKQKFIRRYKHAGAKHGVSISFPERCYWPWSGFFVMANGDATPCCAINSQDGNIMGNMLTQSLAQIWDSQSIKKLRLSFIEGNPMPCCKECNFS